MLEIHSWKFVCTKWLFSLLPPFTKMAFIKDIYDIFLPKSKFHSVALAYLDCQGHLMQLITTTISNTFLAWFLGQQCTCLVFLFPYCNSLSISCLAPHQNPDLFGHLNIPRYSAVYFLISEWTQTFCYVHSNQGKDCVCLVYCTMSST